MFVADTPPAVVSEAKVTPYPAAYFAPFRPDTAYDMVQRLPGFTFDNGGNQRGFGAESNVRLDGQLPASRGDGMQAILRRLPASSVERIELITGGAGGVDMQGASVVANVVRKADQGLKTTVTAGGGVYEDGRGVPTVRLEVQKQAGDQLFDGLFIYYDELDGSDGTRLRGANLSTRSYLDFDVRNRNVRGSGAYERPLGDGRLRLNLTWGQTKSFQDRTDTPLDATPAPSDEDILILAQLAEGGARYTRTLPGGTALELLAFQQFNRNDQKASFLQGPSSSLFALDRRSSESILKATLRPPKRGAFAFDGGLEADYNRLETATSLVLNNTPQALPAASIEVEELRGQAFATATWTPSPKISLALGLRYEASDIQSSGSTALAKNLEYLKPRAILTWTPAKGHLATLRVERVVDQLSFDDFAASASLLNGTVAAGNPDLLPQDAILLEGRYERRFADKSAFTILYQHQEVDEVIARRLFPKVGGGDFEAAGNVGEGEKNLVALSAALPLDRFGVPGGFLNLGRAWRWSELIDPTTGTPRRFSSEAAKAYEVHFAQTIPNSPWRWGADMAQFSRNVNYLPRETSALVQGAFTTVWAEYRPQPSITWRLDIMDPGGRRNLVRREITTAPRGAGPVTNRERRNLGGLFGGQGVRLTLRRSF